jgi:deoxyadenosine/deoxycytidine kinase
VIYLQAKPETLIARVRRRGIDMERRSLTPT